MDARPGGTLTKVGRFGPGTSEKEAACDSGLASPQSPRVCPPPAGYTCWQRAPALPSGPERTRFL